MAQYPVHNNLKTDNPYYGSKTKLQWQAAGFAVIGEGQTMWTNQHCGSTAIYFSKEEVRPATDEEIARWKQERKEERKAQAEERRRAWQAMMEKEEAEERRYIERQRSAWLAEMTRHHAGMRDWQTICASIPKNKIICFDVETTGLSPYQDEILQFSCIDGNGNVLLNTYIKPERHEEWCDAQRIHGISPADVADCQSMNEWVPRINEIVAGAELIVTFNGNSFDRDFLQRAGVVFPDAYWFDVMLESAPVIGDWSEYHKDFTWPNLAYCASFFKYKGTGEFHDGLEDVRATIHCFNELLQRNYTEVDASAFRI